MISPGLEGVQGGCYNSRTDTKGRRGHEGADEVDYGVRALVDLAQRYGGGSVQTVEVADRQGIPEPYLDQLLATLGECGFIRSRRGPQEGHVLAKAPHER